nr:hypothetical protein [Tanacetum cinerariifolium]
MVTGSGSLRSGWLTKDMVHSIKSGNQVSNSKPLPEFNPSVGHVVKSVVDTPKDVTDKALAENECVQFVCLVVMESSPAVVVMFFGEELAKAAKSNKIKDQMLVLMGRQVETELKLEEKLRELFEEVSTIITEREDVVEELKRLNERIPKKDKIGSKPDKNEKRGEAEKSQKQLQWIKQEILKKMQKEGPEMQIIPSLLEERNTTYSANSLLEEFTDELALITYPPDYDDNRTCDIESDIREIEFLLYQGEDSDFKDSIDQTNLANLDDLFVDPTPEMFTDEPPSDYSFPPRFDVYPDDFLEIESDADNFDDDFFDSKGEKIKESEILIDQLDLPCDILSEYDSFNSQDFSKDDDLPSPDNEDKVFNPKILIHEKSVKIITRVAQEKKLAVSFASLLFEDFDPPFYEPLVFKEVSNSMRLLPISFENEEKVFKPGIYTSKKVHSCFLPELSHPGYHVFKVNMIFLSMMRIFHVQSGKNTPLLDVLLFYFYPP